MESLANNHPFLDGHKRVAFAATHTFLLVNRLTSKWNHCRPTSLWWDPSQEGNSVSDRSSSGSTIIFAKT